jgi:hypothetical protein
VWGDENRKIERLQSGNNEKKSAVICDRNRKNKKNWKILHKQEKNN